MKSTLRLNPSVLESESLLNCWIREGGLVRPVRPGWLRIPLHAESRDGRHLEVFYSSRTLLGDVRLSHPVQYRGEDSLAFLSPLDLADILVEEIRTRAPAHLPHSATPRAVPDWRENIADSIKVTDRIFRESGAPARESRDFIASEQSLAIGHRFHPSPKSRIGFDDEDLRRYSPEWGASFSLHYLAVRVDALQLRGEDRDQLWTRFTQECLDIPANAKCDHAILPIHPWQAARALSSPELRALIEQRRVIDLGRQGPRFFATSSVRTLYQPERDFFVKTSLDVRITNCFRRNLPGELSAIQRLRAVLRALQPNTGKIRILDEPLSMDVDEPLSYCLGVIFREGIARERSEGLEPILTGALFGERDHGSQRLARLVSGDVRAWFQRYCEALVPPVLEAFFTHGLMFEPHLQNVLVCLDRAGMPARFILRDLDNTKLLPGSPARAVLRASEAESAELTYPEDYAWRRLVYCLFVNHLSEAIASLARVRSDSKTAVLTAEGGPWDTLREVLEKYCAPHPRLRALLEQPTLWAKKNFFTRVTRTPDKDAPFAEVPNPLRARATASLASSA